MSVTFHRCVLIVGILLVGIRYTIDTVDMDTIQDSVALDDSQSDMDASEYAHAYAYIPRISIFSGSAKGATSFDIWRYEINCLKTHYSENVIRQAIRRSLRGEASKAIMCLGPNASVTEILHKMDSIYGIVERQEKLLGEFYSAKQNDDETVADWSCRLEELLGKVDRISPIDLAQKDDMLRNVFWHGLCRPLKDTSGHKFDSATSFDELRIAIRQIECSHPVHQPVQRLNKKSTHVDKAQHQSDKVIKDLMREIDGLRSQVRQMEAVHSSASEHVDVQHVSQQSHFDPYTHVQLHDEGIVDYDEQGYDYDYQEPVCYRCGQPGHIALGCRVRLDHSRRSHVMSHFTQWSQGRLSKRQGRSCAVTGVVGDSNEATIELCGVECRALLDTGSTVSTISHGFYQQYLSHLPMEPLDSVLHIQCADGSPLPYLGYIVVELHVHGISQSRTMDSCCFLVVNDTEYHRSVPALIGTNVLTRLMDQTRNAHGDRYLQSADMHTPWFLAFRCLSLREKELTKHQHRLALIKSAERRKITIPANSEVVIQGYMDKELPYQPVCAILQPTHASYLPSDFDISPTLISYDYKRKDVIPVHITNVTTRTITVPPKALLCEVQPVDIEELDAETRATFMDEIEVDSKDLTSDELSRGLNIINKFKDIFSQSETDIGLTSSVKHRIELTNTVPFKQRHRRIPPSMIDELRNHLQLLMTSGVIRKSRSPWASNIVLCRKKNGQLRMCVDYRQLNQRTIKDAYALPRISDILDSLLGNKYFTVLDMKSGYHQIEIDDEHKDRTAFTVGPLGFYEYIRMPFGLANAPATYQRLMEDCFTGLNLDICFIYLDDVIIFSKTYEEHLERLEQVFKRIKENGLKLSPSKCQFFKRKVKYIGHVVSESGVEPDPDKLEKVKTWPRPTNPEEVRKFLGFVGYYRKFINNF